MNFKEFLEQEGIRESYADLKGLVDNPYGVGASNAYIEAAYGHNPAQAVFATKTADDRTKVIKNLVDKGVKKKDIFTSKGNSGEMYPFKCGFDI